MRPLPLRTTLLHAGRYEAKPFRRASRARYVGGRYERRVDHEFLVESPQLTVAVNGTQKLGACSARSARTLHRSGHGEPKRYIFFTTIPLVPPFGRSGVIRSSSDLLDFARSMVAIFDSTADFIADSISDCNSLLRGSSITTLYSVFISTSYIRSGNSADV